MTSFNKKIKYLLLFTFFLSIGILLLVIPVKADLSDHQAPKTVALYLNSGYIDEDTKANLAKWDLVILDMQVQYSNPDIFQKLRKRNPDVVILAYTSAIEYPKDRIQDIEPNLDGAWSRLGQGLDAKWILHTYLGKEVSFWKGNVGLNLDFPNDAGKTYGEYLAEFLNDTILGSNNWDGILFDTVWNDITWFNDDIDIDADGIQDSITEIDYAWFEGHKKFFKYLREIVGDKYYIVTNGVGSYHDYANGRMLEGFPEFWEGKWVGSMENYYKVANFGYKPRLNIINSDTDKTGNFTDYSNMRFGLTSALLGDGYYNFDFGTTDRSRLMYYDEYDVNLGEPKTRAYNLASNIYSMASAGPSYFTTGLWRRDFENGISIVNSSGIDQNVNLNGDFEHLRGTQDPSVNNGKIVSRVDIKANDGLLLMRPLSQIEKTFYRNGAFNRVFDMQGNTVRNGFFSYDKLFSGQVKVLEYDINNDSMKEKIVAKGNWFGVYTQSGTLKCSVYPYTESYKGGVNISAGDLEGDGTFEIVTGTGFGGGPHVRVFNSDCRLINPGFFAYGTNFRGGVNVAIGDLDKDGKDEIVVGAGKTGGPHVRIFNKDGVLLSTGFFAYSQSNRDGVQVALGDVNFDGRDEIITFLNNKSGTVKVFNKDGVMISSEFSPYGDDYEGEIPQLIVTDLDENNRSEILLSTIDVFGSAL